MMRIDFVQPDKDGQLLAIVEVPTPKKNVSDLALIRMSPEAAAILPEWHKEIPGDLEQQLMGARRSMYLDTVERDMRTWKEAGYEVIEHHRNVPMRWTNDENAGTAIRITQAMLRNPMWLAAKVGQAIRTELHTESDGSKVGSASPLPGDSRARL